MSCKGKKVVTNVCWLNSEYIECLKNNLPCECEEKTKTYYSIVIDKNINSKNYGVTLSRFNLMEPYIYPIKKIKHNEYLILTDKNDTASIGKLIIDKNILSFRHHNIISMYSLSHSINKYDRLHYMTDNVFFLNKSLKKRGYTNIEKIVGHDSLSLTCNKSLGNVNLLFVKEQRHSWILDHKKDSLYIDIINNAKSDLDDLIILKNIVNLKWKSSYK